MNMHPVYRARRLRALSITAGVMAAAALATFTSTGYYLWWLLCLALFCAAIAFGVMLRRAEGGVA